MVVCSLMFVFLIVQIKYVIMTIVYSYSMMSLLIVQHYSTKLTYEKWRDSNEKDYPRKKSINHQIKSIMIIHTTEDVSVTVDDDEFVNGISSLIFSVLSVTSLERTINEKYTWVELTRSSHQAMWCSILSMILVFDSLYRTTTK